MDKKPDTDVVLPLLMLVLLLAMAVYFVSMTYLLAFRLR